MDIDIVIPWVDGNDPDWKKEKEKYFGNIPAADAHRFRDWGLLRYWFRCVEENMPWVRKIHFVTWGHIPRWLDQSNPKIHIVRHEDFIPEKYRPVFSSHPIELNLHRIEGLSEHFVYFNDDLFVTAPVIIQDCFIDGLPCGSPVLSPLIVLQSQAVFSHILMNDFSFVNSHFHLKDCVKGNYRKWFSYRLGRYAIKSAYNYFGRKYFLGFDVFHEPSSMLKSTYKKVWELEPALLDNVCCNRFRDHGDVNQYIFTYYQYCTGRFSVRHPRISKYYDLNSDLSPIIRAVTSRKHKFLILNDASLITDFETRKQKLISAFERAFPKKSCFEK